jgi:hypothetical protein
VYRDADAKDVRCVTKPYLLAKEKGVGLICEATPVRADRPGRRLRQAANGQDGG